MLIWVSADTAEIQLADHNGILVRIRVLSGALVEKALRVVASSRRGKSMH